VKVYPTRSIRNVALVAHGGAGKTSLTEAMLFNTGAIKRLGKVDEGNTTTDFQPEEIKRKITVSAAMAPCEWRDYKLNVIDTPGYSDFIGEVKGALRVVDGVVTVLCAVAGVEVQTEIVWDYAEELQLPRIAFINKMDRENANFYQVLDRMGQVFSQKIVPLQLPMGMAEEFAGIIDLLHLQAYKYEAGSGKHHQVDIPDIYADEVAKYRETLIEVAAEADDELLMKYLDGEELTNDEIVAGLSKGVKNATVVPVLCGSALNNMAVQPLMDVMIDYLPSLAETSPDSGKDMEKEPLSAFVFKTFADPYVGKLSFFRVYSGVLKTDTTLYNANRETEEKVSQLLIMQGKNQQSVPELKPGDIGTLAKLQVTTTGDTLTTKAKPIILPGIEFPAPTLAVAIYPKTKGDEDKLGNALARILEEDATLRLEKNVETKETLLTGMGEMHLDITMERLQRKFGVEVETTHPKIPYRETIRVAVTRVEGKHKKQTGGHGQYGHVYIDMEPFTEEPFEFRETIFGGSVPKNYVPAVEKGIRESLNEGVLAGYPVTNVRVTLTDGSYHPVDSSEMAFKIAAGLAFRKALEQAKPVLLEPVMNVEIVVPEQFMGDIIGDLNSKRGRIMGMDPQGKTQIIRAQVPLSEMFRYAIDLKSITQGRGSFKMEFSQYEEVPANTAEKIIEAAKSAKSS
jgi:elongation factor G